MEWPFNDVELLLGRRAWRSSTWLKFVFNPVYTRFNALPEEWMHLLRGNKVLCRCRPQWPQVFVSRAGTVPLGHAGAQPQLLNEMAGSELLRQELDNGDALPAIGMRTI